MKISFCLLTDANEAKDILKSVNKVLANSQEVIEKHKKEINSKEEECKLLKEELSQVQSVKKDIEAKLQSVTESLGKFKFMNIVMFCKQYF